MDLADPKEPGLKHQARLDDLPRCRRCNAVIESKYTWHAPRLCDKCRDDVEEDVE